MHRGGLLLRGRAAAFGQVGYPILP